MNKNLLFSLTVYFLFSASSYSQINIDVGPKNEVFRQTIRIPSSGNLGDPWQITYDPDDSLWITRGQNHLNDSGNLIF